jgi:dTDP-4-amino-4,6-dideoxygalactose transaminase
MSLPMHPYMTETDVATVATALAHALEPAHG